MIVRRLPLSERASLSARFFAALLGSISPTKNTTMVVRTVLSATKLIP